MIRSILLALCAVAGVAHAYVYNPVTDTNWMDFFPLTIAGVSASVIDPGQPHTIEEPPVCLCPSHMFGIPVPGVGMTYWEPRFIVEVTRHPGKLLTLGGADVFGGLFKTETGPAAGTAAQKTNHGETRAQVHWYTYPVFGAIGMQIGTTCTSDEGGFDLAATTEVDPAWQNDIWANILAPESILFANPIAQLACVADAAAAAVHYPLDPLFWCAGSWGSAYPLSGNPNDQQSDQQANALTAAKFLATQARLGMILATIGPEAECSSIYMPTWIKTMYRVDPIYPHATYGAPIYIGQTALRWGVFPPANYPTKQDSAYLIWVAHQCCLRT